MRGALAVLLALWAGSAAACTVDAASYTDFPDSVVLDRGTRGGVVRAWYDGAVTRYDHGILGDAIEAETLVIYAPGGGSLCGTRITLDKDHVFEDVAPRLVDLDGDGINEVITVRTHLDLGAQIAVYGVREGNVARLVAVTPYIGRSHRWLAPIGAADLDGDGLVEIAYIDRPHLAKTLMVWRFENDTLVQVTAASGLTNHRIGEAQISGGIRDCGNGPEMITANADWRRIMAVRLVDGALLARDLRAYSAVAMDRVMACH